MTLIDSLSHSTRQELADQDILFDEQLGTVSPAELTAWVRHRRDRKLIDNWINERMASAEPRGVAVEMLCGLMEARPVRPAGKVIVVRHYVNKTAWSELRDKPGPLTQWFDFPDSGYPTKQRYGSCAAHATGTSLHLRGRKRVGPDRAPSRRYLYVKTGQIGNHGTNEGRSLMEMQTVLHEHGYLLESECPTGEDNFDDLERYARCLELRARERRVRGTIWVDGRDGNRSRLNFAWDLVKGRVTGDPAGLLIAVKVYENWARSFHFGLIRRHHPGSERLLGHHALYVIDVMKLQGRSWVLCANSWGPEFASRSPIGVPGVALCSLDYMKEIMCHGAAVFCRDEKELQTAKRNLNIERPARRKLVATVAAGLPAHTSKSTPGVSRPDALLLSCLIVAGVFFALSGHFIGLLATIVSTAIIIRSLPPRMENARCQIAMQFQRVVTYWARPVGTATRSPGRLKIALALLAGLPFLALAALPDPSTAILTVLCVGLAVRAISGGVALKWATLCMGALLLVASAIAGDCLVARLVMGITAGLVSADIATGERETWPSSTRWILVMAGTVAGLYLILL